MADELPPPPRACTCCSAIGVFTHDGVAHCLECGFPRITEARVKELDPCPFCGGVAVISGTGYQGPADCYDIYVRCRECDSCGPTVLVDRDADPDEELAITTARADWNARAVQPRGTTVDYFDGMHGKTPLHQPSLVEKAVKMANWHDTVAQTHTLIQPPSFEDEPIRLGQNVWLCRALAALSRAEVVKLYDTIIACVKHDIRTGGDFTPQIVRERLPHIYGQSAARENDSDINSQP